MKQIYLLFMALSIVIWTGCSKDEVSSEDCVIVEADGIEQGNNIVLGKKLNNPYSLANMRSAYSQVSSLAKAAIGPINATHLYVKFIPKDSAQFAEIQKDTTIFYYSFPLDYEISETGDCYQEDGGFGYPCQYCVFKLGQKIPDVSYQVLDSCFIMEDVNVYDDNEENSISKACVDDNSYWKELESLAIELSGIETEPQSLSKKWTPYCTLSYYDDTFGKYISLEGVPVRCRNNLMISHQCCTDVNGRASFSKMNGKADYIVHWQRSDFKIRPNTGLNEAVTILKKNTKSSCSATFSKNSGSYQNEWKYASIFRAVYYYYYKNIDGLSRPGCSNLTIRASNAINNDKNGCTGNHFISSDMHIYNLDRSSADIYGTVIHEMAHVSHRCSVCATNKLFNNTDVCIKDSWAVGVQNYLTSKIYSGYKRGGSNRQYSEVVTDILEKQTRNNVASNASYTIAEIEGTLRHARDWEEWKSIVKSKYQRYNEKYIDAVFNYWASK